MGVCAQASCAPAGCKTLVEVATGELSDEQILQSVNSFVAHPCDGQSQQQLQRTLIGNWQHALGALERSAFELLLTNKGC